MILRPLFLLRNFYLYFEIDITASDDLNAPDLSFESHVLHSATSFWRVRTFGPNLKSIWPKTIWPTDSFVSNLRLNSFDFEEPCKLNRNEWFTQILIKTTIWFEPFTILLVNTNSKTSVHLVFSLLFRWTNILI
jgi:hypothetical protein